MRRLLPIACVFALAACDEPEPEVCVVEDPPPARMRLLSPAEYTASVLDLFPGLQGTACTDHFDCDIADESCEDGTCAPDPCGLVTFVLDAPDGPYGSAHVAGTFNEWSPTIAGGWPMTWDDGRYVLKAELGDGEHLYKFVVDESDWRHDTNNPSTTGDGFGGFNSVLVVACDGAAAPMAFDPATSFPAISRPEGFAFDNSVDGGVVTAVHVEAQLEAAADVAARVLVEPSTLADCDVLDDAACRETWVVDLAEQAFRRPLDAEERERWTTLAAPGGETTVSLVVQAMLASPSFLYRPEIGEGGRLTGWETASALSYLLWGGPPDDALRAAAADGALNDADGVEGQARRMLQDPRARRRVERFTAQWLGADPILTADKSAALFGDVSDALRRSMLSEVERTASHVVFDGDGRFTTLLRGSEAMLDPALAAHYGVPAPETTDDDGFGLVTLPPERAGVLGRAAVLGTYAHSDQTSPVRRGMFVRTHLLCQDLGAPPPEAGGVPDVDPDATTRERFAQHAADASCAGCHDYVDEVGFGFEGFDAVGATRATEAGAPVDTSGVLRDVEGIGSETTQRFGGPAELAGLLAESRSAPSCYARHWLRFGLGAMDRPADACAVEQLTNALLEGDDIPELLVALARSDAFLRRSP